MKTDPRRKRIQAVCIRTGTVLQFSGYQEVTDAGFTASSVCRCCAGRRTKHAGYRWSYY